MNLSLVTSLAVNYHILNLTSRTSPESCLNHLRPPSSVYSLTLVVVCAVQGLMCVTPSPHPALSTLQLLTHTSWLNHHSQSTQPNLWLCVKQEAIYSRLIYSSSKCGFRCGGLMVQYIWGKENRRGERENIHFILSSTWRADITFIANVATILSDNPPVRPHVTDG